MGLESLLKSKWSKNVGALTMVVQAGREFARGKVKFGLLYLVGAIVSYKNTAAGLVMQVVLRVYRFLGGK